jgi:hypothetical protein
MHPFLPFLFLSSISSSSSCYVWAHDLRPSASAATVHGALGQTFAAARAAALKAAVATVGITDRFDEGDVVEGKDVDYMTSSLLATDSVFNRFRPHAGIFEKINVITRKLLGLTMDSVDESSTEVSCINQVQGGLHCFA